PQLVRPYVVQGEAVVACAYPQAAEPVARETARALQPLGIAQRGGRFEFSRARIAEHDAAAVGADPQTYLAGGERVDPRSGEGVRVTATVTQLTECVTVETIESALGAEPHEAFAVLRDGIHAVLR